MSKKNKAQKSTTIVEKNASLEDQLVAVVEKRNNDAVAVAMQSLLNDPDFGTIDQIGTLLDEASAIKLELDAAEAIQKAILSRLGDIVLKKPDLQKELTNEHARIEEGLFKDPSMTQKRSLWQQFTAKLEAAVEAGMKATPRVLELRKELYELGVEEEKIRSANERNTPRIAQRREMYDKLTKEAGELMASIQMEA